MGIRTTKSTTDQFAATDIRDLQRRGYLVPGAEFMIALRRGGVASTTIGGFNRTKDPRAIRTLVDECIAL
jgi:hypothetical protein